MAGLKRELGIIGYRTPPVHIEGPDFGHLATSRCVDQFGLDPRRILVLARSDHYSAGMGHLSIGQLDRTRPYRTKHQGHSSHKAGHCPADRGQTRNPRNPGLKKNVNDLCIPRLLPKNLLPLVTMESVHKTQITDPEALVRLQALVRRVAVAPHVADWAIRLTLATHAGGPYAVPSAERWIRVGAGPRAAQSLLLLAKVRAMLAGRHAVAIEDLAGVAPCALRHRLQLSYEAEADRVDADQVVAHLVERTPKEAP